MKAAAAGRTCVIVAANAILTATSAAAATGGVKIPSKMKKIVFFAFSFLFCAVALNVSAHRPEIIYYSQGGRIEISEPEISRAFYDELKGQPRDYFLSSDKGFNLYLNLLVPAFSNPKGRYSARVLLLQNSEEQEVAFLDGQSFEWQEFYEEFGRDYYYRGPEIDRNFPSGSYKIEVFSSSPDDGNTGRYVLAVGKIESFGLQTLANAYWQLPLLKVTFFKTSVLQFFLTPFGIGAAGVLGGVLVLWAFIYYIIGSIKAYIKHHQAKTMLLASDFPEMRDEIIKLLQKPAYDVTVAFVTTALKQEEDKSYAERDMKMMQDMGFNVEEYDIEGKKEFELMQVLSLKDIIFVEGGSTFYLLNAMRKCNFEKVLRKLLKNGIVYIGVSAGSIVVGKTIQTADWLGDDNFLGLRNLKGMNLVPFDIFAHYTPEYAEIIKKKIPSAKKRARELKILTDQQAILVQGKEVVLIGDGEQILV